MSVIHQLASAIGRRDEVPNQELASQLCKSKDKKAIAELAENLNNKDKNIRHDCIKVLYEIGETNPELIAACDKIFLDLLNDKSNRMVWGAMTALDYIASINPHGIYKHLATILDIADKGTVITKDHAISILTKLSAYQEYAENTLALLLDQFKTSATNQLPKYAEDALKIISDKFKKDFIRVLQSRLGDIEKDTKRVRVEKVIKKLNV